MSSIKDIESSKKTVLSAPVEEFGAAFFRDVNDLKERLTTDPKGTILKFLNNEKWTILVTGILSVLLIVLQKTAWDDLSEDAWWTVWSTFVALAAMVRGIADPDLCLFFTTMILLLRHIIVPKEAFAGFSNDSIVTIAIMMVLAAALESTGALQIVSRFMLGSTKSVWLGQARMFSLVAALSAFMNNTPLVAVMIPVVERYCKKNSLPPSKFMIPLSYAAILGGLCTVIGTSTTLIVKGLVDTDYKGALKIGFWDIGIIGLPITVAGLLYVTFLSPILLPNRQPIVEAVNASPYKYIARLLVGSGFRGVGKSVDKAGLRGLHSLFLVDIQRTGGEIISAPSPTTTILEGDVLTFSGDVASVKNLLNLEGLTAADDSKTDKDSFTGSRLIAEAVLSATSPLIGQTVVTSKFRTTYGAAVLAVRQLDDGLGDVNLSKLTLQAGDALLLVAQPEFIQRYRQHADFAVVSDTTNQATGDIPLKPLKMILGSALFATLIIVNSFDVEELSTAGLTCMFAMFLAGILTTKTFREAIPGMILLTVAGAFGIARAMTVTGVAKRLGDNLINAFDFMGTAGPLTAVYLTTVILTALLSNGASVTIVYPIAKSMAKSTGLNPLSFFYLIMLAATSDFSTPIGYQTNLMVAGPGGYEFLDYTKFGVPLQFIVGIISIFISHFYWGGGSK